MGREPLIKSRAVATAAFRDVMREARCSQWPLPLASLATKQTARKAPSLRVAAKCGICVVALLGFVVLATTFVARLAFIRILPATQSVEDLIRGSLGDMAAFRSFEDIEAWQKARELARTIYLVSNSGEFSRDFALRDQIRRAVISIVSNIAEGFERDGNAEFIQLLSVAKGSAGEVRAQLYAALDCGYINSEKFNKLCALASEVSAKLSRLMAYLRNSGMKGKKFK